MFLRRPGVWFGFVEMMFMFFLAKSRKPVLQRKRSYVKLMFICEHKMEEVFHVLIIKAS